MTEHIVPPWKPEEVEALNLYQLAGVMHPFTCANRTDGKHVERDGEDLGLLVATEDGWVCKDCDYVQYWAHDFMLDEQARTPLFPWMRPVTQKPENDAPTVPCTRPAGHLGTCVHHRPSPQGDLCGLSIPIPPAERP